MCKLGVISQERLKIEVKLLFSANRKSYMPRRLAQRITLSYLKFSVSRIARYLCGITELLVPVIMRTDTGRHTDGHD